MNKTGVVIRDAARFTISGYIASVFSFASAIIVRRILGPFFMGIYAELLLVFEYAKYNHLGVIDSLDRQIPYYNGRKEFKKTEEVKNIGISFSLFTSLICVAIIIIFSYLLKDRLSPTLAMGLKVVAIMVVIQSLTTFYVTLVRTHHLFGPLSKYIIFLAICDVLFKLILGIKFGIIGILWATIFTLGIGMVYLFKKAGLRFKITLKIPLKAVRPLLSIGFPLLLAGFTFMALKSIDRIMIIALLTEKDLGFYSIAIMMQSFVFQLPNLMYTVLFPRFYERFGSFENDIGKLKGYIEKPTLAFAYLFPIFIGLAVICLPVFINYVLPKYTQGVKPASILLFGTVFLALPNMSGYLLVALKKQRSLVVIGAVSAVISVFLNLIFVKIFHMGIKGIALGTSITYFLYSFFLIGYALKQYMKGLYSKAKFFIGLYAPLAWVLIIFCIFGFVFSYDFENLKSDLLSALLQMVIFSILTLPLLLYVNKKIGLYNSIKNAGLSFFKK